jgi:hypothetical protein
MGQRYTTYQTEVPVVFPMPCVRHALVGQEAQAEFLVLAKNGVGLAACAEHRDLTVRVVRELDTFEDTYVRAVFILTEAARRGDDV